MVRELYDKQKIREVVTRYCRGVDRMDRDLFLSAYHPDAIDDHGFVVAGPEAFWAWVHHYHNTAQSKHQHIITNHHCELDGNIDHHETYWRFAAHNHKKSKRVQEGQRVADRRKTGG